MVVLSATSRINKLEKNIKGFDAQINENSVLIEEGLNSMEVNGDIELQQRVRAAEHVISRLEDLIQRQESISMKYGTIKNTEANDIIKLEIKEYDPHKDEYSSELISLELAKDCKAYFYSEIGLVEASLEDLIAKVTMEVSEKFEDEYTFIIIDNKVVQVYQGYQQ